VEHIVKPKKNSAKPVVEKEEQEQQEEQDEEETQDPEEEPEVEPEDNEDFADNLKKRKIIL